ncbi:MAG TPA: hypothetical protein VFX59_14890 [Polyangiales bacterium]|nr:hypothetical protein [Polyangiales bacterium]
MREYGTHLVRVRDTRVSYRGWWPSTTPPKAFADVIAAQGDPDTNPTLASIAILLASGPYGLRAYDANTYNLLSR